MGGERRRQDQIEKAARGVLRRAAVSTRDEKGTAIVYDFALGLAHGKVSAVPGLLIQLPHGWYFAGEGPGRVDVVHAIDPGSVRDMRSVTVPEGVVVVIELQSATNDPELIQLLVAGSDASSSALQIGYALGRDAGLVDENGKPTEVWKARVARSETELERVGRVRTDPSVPSGIGYMQSVTGVPASGPYVLTSDGEFIRGEGAVPDALLIDWDDVEEYWQGEITFPDFLPRSKGVAIVLALNPSVHGRHDLVIHPDDVVIWHDELDRQGFDPW